MRTRELGSANWPFIISFVLLLCFGWLWFDQKSEADKSRDALKKAQDAATVEKGHTADREDLLTKISEVVGFRKGYDLGGGPVGQWTDPALIAGHLQEAGEVTKPDNTKGPGLLNELKTLSRITIRRDLYKAGAPGKEQPLDLSKISPAFKAKVDEVKAAFPKDPPTIPADDDDAESKAKYESERAKYEAATANYMKLLQELVAMGKDWEAYKGAITGTAGFEMDAATGNMVEIVYYEKPPSSPMTVENLLAVPAPIIAKIVKAFSENKVADLATLEGLRKTNSENEKAIAEVKDTLATEQNAHTADVTKLSAERDEANARAEAARVSDTNAQKALATIKDNSERELRKKEATITAWENKGRIDKEVRDLEIKRDDKDGEILEASATLGTGYINLGAADKVFAGLTFNVSYIGRGGIRIYKGQVMVLKVLDAHYSQVSLSQQASDEKPIGSGDMISNPFFNATKAIHVFIAGELKKYPKAVAAARLKEMNVVIDDVINDHTDYVIAPDSMTAKPAGPAAGGDAGAAPAAGEKTSLEKLVAMAQTFGATVITEKVLEQFLHY